MKSLRNKVILSGIVLLFAFIATIGSTYAWFTVSSDTTVEGINLQVTAAENLLIKAKNRLDGSEDSSANLLDASYYENSIDLPYLISKGYFYENITVVDGVATAYDTPWRLQPSTVLGGGSTATAISLTYINNINAVMAGDPVTPPSYATATANSSTGHYVTIEFYLLSQSSSAENVALTGLTISSSTGNSTAQNIISNAVQVAFTFDDETTLSSAFVYGNDPDYAETIPVEGSTAVPAPTATAPTVSTPVTTTASLYSLQPNTPTLVTVTIFIEGWDEDASNDIIRAFFDISFGFSIIE